MHRTLYVLKFRPHTWQPKRELSSFDRLAGWRDQNGDGEPCMVYHHDGRAEGCIVNEGHEHGSLHSRTGPHVLSWDVQPGDEVLVKIAVDLFADHARYKPWIRDDSGNYWLVRCESVLGRAVALGEDGAEDAFGGDALRSQVEEATFARNFCRSQCECKLEAISESDELPPEVVVALTENMR